MKKIGTKIFSLLAVLFVIFFVFAAVILASLNSIKSAALFEVGNNPCGNRYGDRTRAKIYKY